MFFTLTWIACGPAPTGDPGPLVDTGWEPNPTRADIEPTWTGDEALDRLQAALDAGLPSPQLARDTFLGLIEVGQDATCPGTTDFDGAEPLGCLSESGYLYAGISQYLEDPNGWALGGDFEIREPSGRIFHGAGHVFVHGNVHGSFMEFSGSWIHEAGEDWLDPGASGVFQANTGGGRIELLGGLSLRGASLHFDEVLIQDHPQSMSGRVGIRDPAGAWWWLELDNDGCGPLTFADQDVTTGCIDLAAPIGVWSDGLHQ